MNTSQYLWCIKTLKQAYQVKCDTGFPASAMTAQAILETGYGKYIPIDINNGKVSHNLFGIKGAGENGFIECYTHEWNPDWQEFYVTIARFRAYWDYEGSFRDYVDLIRTVDRYKSALDYLNQPKRYIYELWKAGYATDPNYPTKVSCLIDTLNKIPIVLLNI